MVEVLRGTTNDVYGGGYAGPVLEKAAVTLKSGTVKGSVYGGGHSADAKVTHVTLSGGEVQTVTTGENEQQTTTGGSVYGGGFKGAVEQSNVTLSGTTIHDDVYGGGFEGKANGVLAETTAYNTNVTLKSGTVKGSVYGGGEGVEAASGKTHVVIEGDNGLNVVNVFGGGNAGAVTETLVTQTGNTVGGCIYGGGNVAATDRTTVKLIDGVVDKSVFGGGYEGTVTAETETFNTVVEMAGGTVNGSVYGGGEGEEATTGKAGVKLTGGTVNGSIYGGGYAAKTTATDVQVTDQQSSSIVIVAGDVFGGGEGKTATVTNATNVDVNLKYVFTAEESAVTVTDQSVQSGQITTQITEAAGPFSKINGSVYGGGDLGQVGVGTINVSSNSANIQTPGTVKVTVNSGHIKGSVFGGGNGEPPENESFEISMGAVFGSTETNIYGGRVETNVYGGGKQSRLFAVSTPTSGMAAVVNIQEQDKPIAIEGSVFGGGDRGSSVNTNASVPTTIGDVEVNITGGNSGDSRIYFVNGGVYGDGNLCLVQGRRVVNMTNFTLPQTSNSTDAIKLKTFYSLQRADEVNLSNTDIVLLGAVDLVAEGDSTIYSINRVGELNLNGGSTVKLSGIVKYLEAINSDYTSSGFTPDRHYIELGYNGENGYEGHGWTSNNNVYQGLTSSECETYIRSDAAKKNTVCVANGLYLEVRKSTGGYGPVKGLFTLQLLHANAGEGGGFVYADIATSTGDFICETKTAYKYTAVKNPDENQIGNYFTRQPGKGYIKAESFVEGTIYFTRTESDAYMPVVDNVGGQAVIIDEETTQFQYYYWYINGATIYYDVNLTGYIGAAEETFEKDSVIPRHEEDKLNYLLFDLRVDEKLEAALTGDKKCYELVQRKDNLVNQQIAIEVMLGDESLGFLANEVKEGEYVWGLKKSDSANLATGYRGYTAIMNQNTLTSSPTTVDSSNAAISLVLHKSKQVNTERTNMGLEFEIDLYDQNNEIYGKGSSTLVFENSVSIVRLNPSQKRFASPGRMYNRVSLHTDSLHINGASSFTTEYLTEYIPMAFAQTQNNGAVVDTMTWKLSTEAYEYYFDAVKGKYFTKKGDDFVKVAEGLTASGNGDGAIQKDGTNYFYMADGQKYWFERKNTSTASSKLPAGTKITMIDLTVDQNNNETPEYYYYICNDETASVELNDFMVMGTAKKIRDLGADEKPTYLSEYLNRQNDAVRVNEALLFVLDFSAVNWETEMFDGTVTLQHLYGNTASNSDIMDYVSSTTEIVGGNEQTTHNRFMPLPTEFSVDEDATGIESFTVTADTNFPEFGAVEVTTAVVTSTNYVDARFDEGEFSLKVELLDDNGVKELPEGFQITVVNGQEESFYHPGIGHKFVIIPMAGKVQRFVMESPTYSLKEYLKTDSATFRVTLYSAPDAAYLDTDIHPVEKQIMFTLSTGEIYSLKVQIPEDSDQILAKSETLSVIVDKSSNTDAVYAVQVQKKGENGYAEVNNAVTFNTVSNTLSVSESAKSGTYRLVFRYGPEVEKNKSDAEMIRTCVEYLNFIVE